MEENISRQFFLGANTGAGFVSLYPAFAAPEDGAFVWYIKGGPGNGKSTLMRRAAERAEGCALHCAPVENARARRRYPRGRQRAAFRFCAA